MGIINPRPAMRRGEERRLHSTLAQHAELRKQIREAGASDEVASKIAFDIVNTRARRSKLWRAA
jgi:hypothetical protein